MFYVLDGGGSKDSKNTLNSFFTKRDGNVFWQIGADMFRIRIQLFNWKEWTYQLPLCFSMLYELESNCLYWKEWTQIKEMAKEINTAQKEHQNDLYLTFFKC